MQRAANYESVDEAVNLQDKSAKRTWTKPAALLAVVLVICVGFALVGGEKSNTFGSSAVGVSMFAETATGRENVQESPMPAFEDEAVEDTTLDATADFVAGSVVGRGVFWIPARGQNCNRACAGRRMSAVASGRWAHNKKPFYVCGARGTRRHPGMRTGFNLPGWNNGKCAIAYGRWVNRAQFQCLCRKPNSRSRWVSNLNKYSSCRRVCEKESPKMVAVSSGSFLNQAKNPRYEVCAACKGFDCRSGWNLGLVGWGESCVSPYGRKWTKTTGFKCFCAVPQPCRARPPRRCPVRVRVIKLGAFYRYWKASIGDHFYTRNAGEIGTTVPGKVGKFGYKSEGIACYLATRRARGLVPLYRYWKAGIHADHFYTTNAGEIGTTVPGRVGKYGYRSEGISGYCSPKAIGGTVPLYRYWNPRNTDHFYTTNWGELGAGRHGWGLEGIQCYVWTRPRARLVLPGAVVATMEDEDEQVADDELEATADLGEELAATEFHVTDVEADEDE